MKKISKEEFWTLVNLLEKVAPRPTVILTTKGMDGEDWDVSTAIDIMKNNSRLPPVDRFINPWTYDILRQAGLFE